MRQILTACNVFPGIIKQEYFRGVISERFFTQYLNYT